MERPMVCKTRLSAPNPSRGRENKNNCWVRKTVKQFHRLYWIGHRTEKTSCSRALNSMHQHKVQTGSATDTGFCLSLVTRNLIHTHLLPAPAPWQNFRRMAIGWHINQARPDEMRSLYPPFHGLEPNGRSPPTAENILFGKKMG